MRVGSRGGYHSATAAAVLALAAALASGCSAHHPSVLGTTSGPPQSNTTTSTTVLAGGKTPPACSTAVARQATLSDVITATAGAGTDPFGVAATTSGRFLFVVGGAGITVFSISDGGRPELTALRTVSLPGGAPGRGDALTPDGRELLVAAGQMVVVLNVAALESGRDAVVDGTLADGGAGAIEVTTSRDGRFAFASFENSDEVGVFDLARALADGFGAREVSVGTVRVGEAPVGIAVSPDGRFLYVTSEVDPTAGHYGGRVPGGGCGAGSLSVIRVAAAERDPSTAGRVVAPAGTSPVRVALGEGGAVAWVTARGSNDLLAFSTRLLTAPDAGTVVTGALVAVVPVGAAPVGVALAAGGRFVVVADSNRFSGSRKPQWLSVVDAADALAGRPSLLGRVPAGVFPRDETTSVGGDLVFVSDFDSAQVEVVRIGEVGLAGARDLAPPLRPDLAP